MTRSINIIQQPDCYRTYNKKTHIERAGLEPLARRMWPNQFSKKVPNRYGKLLPLGLSQVLCDVLRDKSAKRIDDRRFAATCLSVYDYYRCPASHDLDSFQCSFEEARYVLAVIRMLLTLSEKGKK